MLQILVVLTQRFCGRVYGLLVIEEKTTKDSSSKASEKYNNQESIKRYWK